LGKPGASKSWVFLDEHPDSINDAAFYVNPFLTAAGNRWIDTPSSLHNGACSFSFADGHAEIKKWRESSTIIQVRANPGITLNNISVPNSRDFDWVAEHTPRNK
jgi:prepilin-type processing-associated H-X9-DG protein